MPLDLANGNPMYLLGRLAAISERGDDRVSQTIHSAVLGAPRKGLALLHNRIEIKRRHSWWTDTREMIVTSIMEMMPPEGAPASVRLERQTGYWLGYHHQRGYPRHVAIERAQLERAGTALFGDRWQSDIARLLGWDSARIRQVLSNSRPMPGGAMAEIIAELRQRATEVAVIANEMEETLQAQAAGASPG